MSNLGVEWVRLKREIVVVKLRIERTKQTINDFNRGFNKLNHLNTKLHLLELRSRAIARLQQETH